MSGKGNTGKKLKNNIRSIETDLSVLCAMACDLKFSPGKAWRELPGCQTYMTTEGSNVN